MSRVSTIAPLLAGLCLACIGTAQADGRRIALSIGSSACPVRSPLPKAVGDARAIADMFRAAGFESVRTLTDPRRDELSTALTEFTKEADGADIAVVFYAGCGAEIRETAYLIPADAKVANPEDLAAAVPMDDVLRALKPAKRLGLVLYDASRSDPFAGGTRRRAAPRAVAGGPGSDDPMGNDTLIGYATKAMGEASDGEGAHSPFTTALLVNLPVPGLDIRLAFSRIRDDVLKATNRMQEPFVYGSLGGGTIALVPAARR